MKALLDLAEKENTPLWQSQIALWIEQQGRSGSGGRKNRNKPWASQHCHCWRVKWLLMQGTVILNHNGHPSCVPQSLRRKFCNPINDARYNFRTLKLPQAKAYLKLLSGCHKPKILIRPSRRSAQRVFVFPGGCNYNLPDSTTGSLTHLNTSVRYILNVLRV